MSALLNPEERVLSTLNADGTRRWIKPKAAKGPLRNARLLVGWALIALFVVLPHIRVGGRQWFFMNILDGEFTFFGFTLVRTDTVLLALSTIAFFIAVFLLTALVGRVWCGWGCPQTVYLEFVYRPIERFFDGKRKKGVGAVVSSLPQGARKALRFGLSAVVSFLLANTFLAYFVGAENLYSWVLHSPAEHPIGFGVVLFVTAAMMFDFMFFREQLCIIACPYGRFQSVLLDAHSLIVGYDTKRGEPRGKKRRKKPAGDVPLTVVSKADPGDCVDCGNCVAVCPTGIDIRDGLQMECIHCTQCIDACNDVMKKLGRELGLIRYSSQHQLETGKRSWARPRVLVYPAILLVLLTAISVLVIGRAPADVKIVRERTGQLYSMMPDGSVSNRIRVRVTNRTPDQRRYTISSDEVGLTTLTPELVVEPGETASELVIVSADPGVFAAGAGRHVVKITVSDDLPGSEQFEQTLRYTLMGPSRPRPQPDAAQSQPGSAPDQAETKEETDG